MGDVVNIGERYNEDYGRRIQEIEAQIAEYDAEMESLLVDMLDPALTNAKEAKEIELHKLQTEVNALGKELEKLKSTLQGL